MIFVYLVFLTKFYLLENYVYLRIAISSHSTFFERYTKMSNVLSVTVTNRKTSTGEFYEGTVSIEGLKPTKLARRSDGSTMFPTKSALSGAARNLAKSLGFSDVNVSDSSKTVAAKKTKTVAAAKSASLSSKGKSVAGMKSSQTLSNSK